MEAIASSIHGQPAVLPPFWRKTVDATAHRVIRRRASALKNDLALCPQAVKNAVEKALTMLLADPVPASARFFGRVKGLYERKHGLFYLPLDVGMSLVYEVRINLAKRWLEINPLGVVPGDAPTMQ